MPGTRTSIVTCACRSCASFPNTAICTIPVTYGKFPKAFLVTNDVEDVELMPAANGSRGRGSFPRMQ